eukprot:scaffold120990_cov63-Phaeocystis_antarctica.AAC.2
MSHGGASIRRSDCALPSAAVPSAAPGTTPAVAPAIAAAAVSCHQRYSARRGYHGRRTASGEGARSCGDEVFQLVGRPSCQSSLECALSHASVEPSGRCSGRPASAESKTLLKRFWSQNNCVALFCRCPSRSGGVNSSPAHTRRSNSIKSSCTGPPTEAFCKETMPTLTLAKPPFVSKAPRAVVGAQPPRLCADGQRARVHVAGVRAADGAAHAQAVAECRREAEEQRVVEAVAVELGHEIYEHPQPELVAVQQHELALGAHQPHRALELAGSLQVAIVRTERARAVLGAGARRGHRRARRTMGERGGGGGGGGGVGGGTDGGRGRRSVRGGGRRADLRTNRVASTRACPSALPSVASVPLAPPPPPTALRLLSCLGILHHDWRRHELQPFRARPGGGHGATSRGHQSANEHSHGEGRGRRALHHRCKFLEE